MKNAILDSPIAPNLANIQQQITDFCAQCGRNPKEITLLPVTKTQSIAKLQDAFALGLNRFGENRVQEAQDKAEQLKALPINWCIIGHLQTNKAKYAARFAQEIHSLDSIKLAEALDKHLQKSGRAIKVLIQVNTSDEPQKYGLHPDQLNNFIKQLPAFASLKVSGLMTMAMQSENPSLISSCFSRLAKIREKLRQESPDGLCWDTLSMGMSKDFPLAIAQGATEIRIGSGIFSNLTNKLESS